MSGEALDAHLLARIERVLSGLGGKIAFNGFEEFQQHSSAFFLAAFQIFTKRTIPEVNRAPITNEDHEENAQLFLDHLRQHCRISLQGVTAETICNGERDSLLQCIEVIEFLQRKRARQAHSPNAFRNENESQEPYVINQTTGHDTLSRWNAILEWLSLPNVSSWQELRENGCSVFTLAMESILSTRLSGIIRRPLLYQHYVDNANIAHQALCQVLGRPINDFTAVQIAEGNTLSLTICADLLLEASKVNSGKSATRNREDERGEMVVKEVLKGKSELTTLVKSTGLFSKAPVYNDLLLRQVQSIERKQEIELNKWNERVMGATMKEMRRDQAWKQKVQMDIQTTFEALKKIRNDNQRYEVDQVFKKALKLERDYMREQHKTFSARKHKLEQDWMNKKVSIESFFRDKYTMLSQGIENARHRQVEEEKELRRSLRRLEKDLKDERREGLNSLRDKITQSGRAPHCDIQPEKVLERLLKMTLK